ncbi:MAG: hypothetical protein ABH879_00450 [archaeon]
MGLKEIETKAWTSTFEDGITDIVIGLILVVSTICQLFDDLRYYLYPLYLVPVVFSMVAKRYVTVPRMGRVKFSVARNRKLYLLVSIMTASILLLLMLTFFGKLQQIANAGILVGVIVFTICVTIAYFMNFHRMYVYAVLFTASFAMSELAIARTGSIPGGAYAWAVSAAIILTIGAYHLVRFIKRYPEAK